MTLHEHRGRLERSIAPFASWCHRYGIGPNHLTLVSLVLHAVAAVVFLFSGRAPVPMLVAGTVLLAVGAFLDSADGVLARMTDQATALGDYLDHAIDRFADVLILLGLTFSPWVEVPVGLFALVGTLLTSYMGTQAQAVGVGRDYSGLMGRADRLFLLFLAPLAHVVLVTLEAPLPYDQNAISLAIWWIAIAGNVTAIQRFWGGLSELRERAEP